MLSATQAGLTMVGLLLGAVIMPAAGQRVALANPDSPDAIIRPTLRFCRCPDAIVKEEIMTHDSRRVNVLPQDTRAQVPGTASNALTSKISSAMPAKPGVEDAGRLGIKGDRHLPLCRVTGRPCIVPRAWPSRCRVWWPYRT